MSVQIETKLEGEPPSTAMIGDASSAARVDRVMAVAHLPTTAHVAAGLDVISFDHVAQRLVLGVRPGLPMAACQRWRRKCR